MDIQVTVRESDVALLEEIAERDWRNPPQQASAMIEAALATARARANGRPARTTTPRRTPSRSNGVARVEA